MSIYIVSNKVNIESNMFKVGKSTQSSADIIKRYKTALGEPYLILHHHCENYSQVEKDLHKLLESHRTEGEWFKIPYFVLMQRVINYLDSNKIGFGESSNSPLLKKLGKLTKAHLNKMGFVGKNREGMVEKLIASDKTKLLLLNSEEKKKVFCCNSEEEANCSIKALINNREKITIDDDLISKIPLLTVAQLKQLGAKGKKKEDLLLCLRSNTALLNNITPEMKEKMSPKTTKKDTPVVDVDLSLLTVTQLKELGAKGKKKADLVAYVENNKELLAKLTDEMKQRMSKKTISDVKSVVVQRLKSTRLPFPADKLTVAQLKELGAKGKKKIDLVTYVENNKELLAGLTDEMCERILLLPLLEKNSTEKERDQWEEELGDLTDLIEQNRRSIINSVFIK